MDNRKFESEEEAWKYKYGDKESKIKCQRKNCILRYCVLFRFYVG